MSRSEFPDLRPLLSPGSIAIIGASPEIGKPMSFYIKNLLKHGYKGNVYPVNPKYANIQGTKCYSSIHDIPGEIDTVSIALRNADVLGALKDCAKKGVRSAIVFSAGFAEIGEEGKNLQNEISELARMSGMRIIGPNCNGIMNINDQTIMSLFFYPDMESTIPGEVSLVSQSGTIPLLALARGYERGIGFRSLISVGNEADLDIADVIGFLTEDEQTRAITGYIEGIKDVKKFVRAAGIASLKKKPIILLHATRYESSMTAARYHTNAYTEPGYNYNTVFTENNIVTVGNSDELLEFGFMFATTHIPAGGRIGILNTTGGITVLSADVSSELQFIEERYEVRDSKQSVGSNWPSGR
jgi:acyl-CoA synthetase (NDP forming)